MAAVWAARRKGAHGFSRIVALKTMLPELSGDADFERMFLSEARIASRIRHPNVVETLDLGEEEQLLYLVMEWVDGETLSALMKAAAASGGVPRPIALKIVIDACAGAHAAHELCDDDNLPLGLVHRDVSPPNVLVSYSGEVKLADFGVAKTIELNNGCTQTGQVKGKLRYMAPEQLRGDPIDRRVDVFALGISLYQLTTGRHPWPGDTAAVTMRRILSETPDRPASLVAKYPEELERIVLKALARDPVDRFQTAADFGLALEAFARASESIATTREVGAYVSDLLGARGATRRNALRAAAREADSRNPRADAKQLQRIDEAWNAAPAPIDKTPTPSRPSNDGSSLRPWSTTDPKSPIFSMASARTIARPKHALFVGAAVAIATIAFTFAQHRSSSGAAATVAPPEVSRAEPDTHLECAVPTPSSVEPTPSASAAAKIELPRPRPPVFVPRRPRLAPSATATAHESEPDVGF
jgi:serine/threonine-protein kinase